MKAETVMTQSESSRIFLAYRHDARQISPAKFRINKRFSDSKNIVQFTLGHADCRLASYKYGTTHGFNW